MRKIFTYCLFIYYIISGRAPFFKEIYCNALNLTLKNIISDVKEINRNVLTIDSLKIVAGFMPVYALTFALDSNIHGCFYNMSKHKNLRQLPKHTNYITDTILAISLISVASLSFLSPDDGLKAISRIAFLGLAFAEITKKILKFIKLNFCLRPFNEKYKQELVYGGFPSGHMMAMSYLTIFFSLQNKFKFSVPFAFASSYIFIDYIIKNRHFVSQLIAGIALGTIYAVASSKAVNKYLDVSISIDKKILRIDYEF